MCDVSTVIVHECGYEKESAGQWVILKLSALHMARSGALIMM